MIRERKKDDITETCDFKFFFLLKCIYLFIYCASDDLDVPLNWRP